MSASSVPREFGRRTPPTRTPRPPRPAPGQQAMGAMGAMTPERPAEDHGRDWRVARTAACLGALASVAALTAFPGTMPFFYATLLFIGVAWLCSHMAPAADPTAVQSDSIGSPLSWLAEPRPGDPPLLEGGVWAWKHKAKSYFRGFFAFFSTLAVLTALAQGVAPSTSFSSKLNTFLPMLYLGAVLSPLIGSAIIWLANVTIRRRIQRGLADIGIGVALTAVNWVPMLMVGRLDAFLGVITLAIAGGVAGFEFWRAEGYPLRIELDPDRLREEVMREHRRA